MPNNQQLPLISKGARIGLLGGSFNPAHKGHLYISENALRELNLDQVWWLVSPGNPLKDQADLVPIARRIEKARKITKGANIEVVDFESQLGLIYTVDTVAAIKTACPGASFVWLMGADSFTQLPQWKSWEEILALVPIAVFPRPGYTEEALSGVVATKYEKFRQPNNKIKTLAVTQPPCWGYIDIEAKDISSTGLRRG